MDPAKSIIDRIGADTAAKVTRKHRSRVYRWTYPKERGGTGGVIPVPSARKLLAFAQAKNIAIDPAEFFMPPAPAKNQRAA